MYTGEVKAKELNNFISWHPWYTYYYHHVTSAGLRCCSFCSVYFKGQNRFERRSKSANLWQIGYLYVVGIFPEYGVRKQPVQYSTTEENHDKPVNSNNKSDFKKKEKGRNLCEIRNGLVDLTWDNTNLGLITCYILVLSRITINPGFNFQYPARAIKILFKMRTNFTICLENDKLTLLRLTIHK